MNKQVNLQDVMLNYVRKEKISVTIYLMNGFQFRGNVVGFDSFTIVIDCEGKQQMVYKHAVSTICPCKIVSLQQMLSSEVEE